MRQALAAGLAAAALALCGFVPQAQAATDGPRQLPAEARGFLDDADGDGVSDAEDACPNLFADSPSGCPGAFRWLTLDYRRLNATFRGVMTSEAQACASYQRVTIKRVRNGADVKVGFPRTDEFGRFTFRPGKVIPGRYYATIKVSQVPDVADCTTAKSPKIDVGKRR